MGLRFLAPRAASFRVSLSGHSWPCQAHNLLLLVLRVVWGPNTMICAPDVAAGHERLSSRGSEKEDGGETARLKRNVL